MTDKLPYGFFTADCGASCKHIAKLCGNCRHLINIAASCWLQKGQQLALQFHQN